MKMWITTTQLRQVYWKVLLCVDVNNTENETTT